MKLWQKVSLICGTILVCIVTACSAVQLHWSREKILNMTMESAAEKQRSVAASFQGMMEYYSAEGDSPAANRALMHYCFSRFADSSCVLTADGETIYSQTDIRPEDYVNAGERLQSFLGEAEDGRYLLVAGRSLRLNGSRNCAVYVVEDITSVYRDIRQMAVKFALVGTVSAGLGLGLIVLLVRRSMDPLHRLQSAAARVAQGEYSQRADVASNDEVGDLARSFNQMAESVEHHVDDLLETANRQRLFIGGVTHEFKTPLTAILLNVDSLQNTCMTGDEQMEALDRIEAQGRWLERMVQKMLKLLTLRQNITLEPIPVQELLERVQNATAGLLQRRGVTLTLDCKMDSVCGDMDLLQSALVNLIDNASKASQSGQTVAVSAYDNRLEVKDWGTGIPASAMAHITEPFYMADKSRSKAQGGVGLGLALVREIALAHGAVLEAESTPGSGTTVTLRFS